MPIRALAETNFRDRLQHNRYPGRGMVLGRSADGAEWLQIYWVMGRSTNSRNRLLVVDGGTLRTAPADPALTDRHTFRPAPPPPGYGLCLTTYEGDGDPLPAFHGDPLWLPLDGAPEAVLDRYWEALDAENRVALALKRIPLSGGPGAILVRNRFAAV